MQKTKGPNIADTLIRSKPKKHTTKDLELISNVINIDREHDRIMFLNTETTHESTMTRISQTENSTLVMTKNGIDILEKEAYNEILHEIQKEWGLSKDESE